MTEAALRLEDVTASWGDRNVLAGAGVCVPAGGCVGIVGDNGTGKTTLLDIVSGFVAPRRGCVELHGRDVTDMRPHRRSRLGLARSFQDACPFESMTVWEVLVSAARARPRRVRTESARAALDAFGLAGHETAFVNELSTGLRRILDLAAAAVGGATMLCLDEPSAGLSPAERTALVETIGIWRRRGSCALLVVDHDESFLAEVADTVLVLHDGLLRPVAGSPTDLAGPVQAAGGGQASSVAEVVSRILAASPPTRTPPAPSLPAYRALRLGLREFAAGMLSVVTLGVLNRVMKVELGIDLWLAATVLASYNLAAPLAVWIGHRSDRRPMFGRHRTPYIVGGSVLVAAATAAAPLVALALSGNGATPLTVGLALAVFTLLGAGMYGSGTAYFALLTDLTRPEERGRAISIVYSMLMAGVLAGVAFAAVYLEPYSDARLVSLAGVVAVLVPALTIAAVWGVEPRRAPQVREAHESFMRLLARLRRSDQARRFFAFITSALFFVFLQQAVLEPFGADVFGMSVRQTTLFNAVQVLALLAGMAGAGKWLSPTFGDRGTSRIGLVVGAAGFALLVAGAGAGESWLVYVAIVGLGLGAGVLNVGALALMTQMTAPGAAGLAMGLWTVSHALSEGLATAAGGLVHDVAVAITADEARAYAAVFALSAAGLLASILLLRRLDPSRFRDEVAGGTADAQPSGSEAGAVVRPR